MILDYVKERYKPEDFSISLEKVAETLRAEATHSKKIIVEDESGFFIYKPQGDSLIVYDIYVKPEKRDHSQAWKFFYMMRGIARDLHKNVIIGFSEKEGKKQHLGKIAMKTAGFQKMFETSDQEVYVRGTH